jgi:hypothetical protein
MDGMSRTTARDQLQERLLIEVESFRRTHKNVIVTPPEKNASGMWEVSFPQSSCIAFDSIPIMLQCLSMVSVPDEDDED